MTIRRGVMIGAGYFSHFHLDAWSRLAGVEIVCVCDLDESKAQASATKHGVEKWTTDASEAMDRFAIDFVDIVTPPASHFELVQLALDRGLPVICQKPLAPDFLSARQLVDLVRKAGTFCMVHENFRWQPWYREIKRQLDLGVIGSQLFSLNMRSRMGDGWGKDAYLARQPYFRDMPRLLVQETGVHFIDTFRYLAGEITEVSADLRQLNPVIAGEDAGIIQLTFENGAIGIWDANRYNESLADDPRYTFGELLVEADGGSIWLDCDGNITIKPLGQRHYVQNYLHDRVGFGGDCVFATQKHFLSCLDGNEKCETSVIDYLKTLQVVEAVYESASQRKKIQLQPDRNAVKDLSSSPRQLETLPNPSSIRPTLWVGLPTNPREVATHESESNTIQKSLLASRRIVDLSLPIDRHLPNALVTSLKTIARDGWNATTLTLYSHCGTHMDAPRHFLPEGKTLDQQDLSNCCGPARVIQLIPIAPRQLITVAQFIAAAGDIVAGERLLLRTDWSKLFGTLAYRDELPRISLELAQWLVLKGVALIGVEPPSVADVNNLIELTAVHQTLFRGNVLIIEGLTNLDQLSRETFDLIALPLNVIGGDGCPVRAIAIE